MYNFALAVQDFEKQIDSFKVCTYEILNDFREFLVKAKSFITQTNCTKIQYTEFVRKIIFNHCGSVLNKAHLWKGTSDNHFSKMLFEDYTILSGMASAQRCDNVLSAYARITVFLFYVVTANEERADYLMLLNTIFYNNKLLKLATIKYSLRHYLDKTLFPQLHRQIIDSVKNAGIPLQQDPATFFKVEDLKACVETSCVKYLELCAL